MTPVFPAQRAAEEFDQVLSGTASPAATDRYADLLETVTVLRAQPEVLPRADFVGDLRARLITAAETELVPVPSNLHHLQPVRTQRSRRRLGTVAASLVLVGGTAGMAAAASGSLPGEGLYPIKRGVEQVETAVHVGDAGKGRALLDQAATRLDEVRALQAEGSPPSDLVAETLASFRSSAQAGSQRLFTAYQSGGDAQDITAVRTFTAEQMQVVAALAGTSATTDSALVDTADTLADIDQQARVLCGSCGSTTALTPPATLASGAGAATVENLLARPVAQASLDIRRTDTARLTALEALRTAAEKAAGKVPQMDLDTLRAAASAPTAAGGPPVTSTLTPDGKLLPSFSSGVAVDDLVSGVTKSLEDLTKTVTGGKTPLQDAVKSVTGTVEDVTKGLGDGLDGTLDQKSLPTG